MLIIHKPEMHIEDGNAILQAVFECDGKKRDLWFSTPVEYSQYLCDERADAFLVALLLYAMHLHQDIKILGSISERLLFTVSTYLIPALCRMRPDFKKININCELLDNSRIGNAGAVGTGISCGIDSLFTVIKHTDEKCLPNFRITHLTFFDVGSHGNTEANSKALFRQRLELVRLFANECGLPLVTLESNIGDILDMFPLESAVTFQNISAVLALQKLFSIYHFSSGTPVQQFKLDFMEGCAYDTFTLSMLETNNLSILPSGTTYSRLEKTNVVAEYEPSYRFLNVCMTSAGNCSCCSKCLRTLLTFEVLGKLERYREAFNLELYYQQRNKFIGLVLSRKNRGFLRDIYDAIREQRFTIPFTAYLWYCYYGMRGILSKSSFCNYIYRSITKQK